jgi:hypothetical protein
MVWLVICGAIGIAFSVYVLLLSCLMRAGPYRGSGAPLNLQDVRRFLFAPGLLVASVYLIKFATSWTDFVGAIVFSIGLFAISRPFSE